MHKTTFNYTLFLDLHQFAADKRFYVKTKRYLQMLFHMQRWKFSVAVGNHEVTACPLNGCCTVKIRVSTLCNWAEPFHTVNSFHVFCEFRSFCLMFLWMI